MATAVGSIFLPLKNGISVCPSPAVRFSQSKVNSWIKLKDMLMSDI